MHVVYICIFVVSPGCGGLFSRKLVGNDLSDDGLCSGPMVSQMCHEKEPGPGPTFHEILLG